MSTSPPLFTPLALLCLGTSFLAHAGEKRTTLGVRLIIVDSCDIHSQSEKSRPDGGTARVACLTGTPYELSLSHPTPPADTAAAMQETASAAITTSALETQSAAQEPSQRHVHDSRDALITTVIF